MSGEVIAKIVLSAGDNGVEVAVDSNLAQGELAPLLHMVAEQMSEGEPPRAAGAWGYRPDKK